jgi:hypothetical protein
MTWASAMGNIMLSRSLTNPNYMLCEILSLVGIDELVEEHGHKVKI